MRYVTIFERADLAFLKGLCTGTLGLALYASFNYFLMLWALGDDALRGLLWVLTLEFGAFSIISFATITKLRSKLARTKSEVV